MTLDKIYVGYYSIGMALAPRISYQNGCQDCTCSNDGEGARREVWNSFPASESKPQSPFVGPLSPGCGGEAVQAALSVISDGDGAVLPSGSGSLLCPRPGQECLSVQLPVMDPPGGSAGEQHQRHYADQRRVSLAGNLQGARPVRRV